jgi:hypothetical protein
MKLEEEIFLNQLAQGIKRMTEGEAWFMKLSDQNKVATLRELNAMIMQASPRPLDVEVAIQRSSIPGRMPQCVMATKPNLKVQLAKIATLSRAEQPRSFRFLVALLGAADERRRKTKPLDLVNHWWHRDLSDERIVTEILAHQNEIHQM